MWRRTSLRQSQPGPYAESCDALNSVICLLLLVSVGSSGSLGFTILSSSRSLNLSDLPNRVSS